VAVGAAARERLVSRQGSVSLRVEDVAVWSVDLREPVDESVLSDEEVDRADRFVFERDRVRFRRRRSQLRHLLGRYVGAEPSDVCFTLGGFGKPAVVGSPLHFSSSSSGDVAMFAVGSHELGVDVELIRPSLADDEVARRLFSAEEAAAVIAGSAADFFRCWTRKEAYVKAIGQGLSFPLESFAIEVTPVPAPRLTRADLRPDDLEICTIADLSADTDELAAALVVRAPAARVMMLSAVNLGGT
jgi:4'-phosphopantetheinyl transferase